MSFHAPAFLIALLLLPIAAGLYVRAERRRSRRAAGIIAPPLLAAVLPRRLGKRRHVPLFFHALALAGLLLALARPHATMAVQTQRATVVVLTDRSGSMQATDVAPNRLVAAKRAAGTFLGAVKGKVRVGAIAFNQQPTVLSSPTADYAAVREAIDGIKPADALAVGEQDDRGGRDVIEVAREAAKAKVPVYTVALGTATGTITDANGKTTEVPPDDATLKEVARVTGGQTFAIENASELQRVYERLGSEVATERKDTEVTSLFAGGALLLAAFGVGASLRTTGRLV